MLEGTPCPLSALVHLESGQTLQFYARPNLMRERDRKEGTAATVIPLIAWPVLWWSVQYVVYEIFFDFIIL